MNNSTPTINVLKKTIAVSEPTRYPNPNHPNQIKSKFVPPDLDLCLSFGPTALAGSIARTSALKNVPLNILDRLSENALNLCGCLIDESSPSLIAPNIKYLADADRISFAGCVGAGITDLLMNELGYAWRDNAENLWTGPHPDFIYGGGAAGKLGVVAAEAHGSFAKSVNNNYIKKKSQDKYCRQVERNLNKNYTTNERVIHGYSIAYGASPTTREVSLHVSETYVQKRTGTKSLIRQSAKPEKSQSVPTFLALATQRANFSLMNASDIVYWIDWLRGENVCRYPIHNPLPGPERTRYRVFSHAGYNFLFVTDTELSSTLLNTRCKFANFFTMEIQCAKNFLNQLSYLIKRKLDIPEAELPKLLEMPQTETFGFEIVSEKEATASNDADSLFAMYRDGLAVFGGNFDPEPIGDLWWIPTSGVM